MRYKRSPCEECRAKAREPASPEQDVSQESAIASPAADRSRSEPKKPQKKKLSLSFYVAGAQYRQDAVQAVNEGDPLFLHRDAGNEHDANAIEILSAAGTLLGYMPRGRNVIQRGRGRPRTNAAIAKLLDGDATYEIVCWALLEPNEERPFRGIWVVGEMQAGLDVVAALPPEDVAADDKPTHLELTLADGRHVDLQITGPHEGRRKFIERMKAEAAATTSHEDPQPRSGEKDAIAATLLWCVVAVLVLLAALAISGHR